MYDSHRNKTTKQKVTNNPKYNVDKKEVLLWTELTDRLKTNRFNLISATSDGFKNVPL